MRIVKREGREEREGSEFFNRGSRGFRGFFGMEFPIMPGGFCESWERA